MDVKDGIAVSPGIAIARAFPLESESFLVSSRPIEASEVEGEIARFFAAVEAASEAISSLRDSSGLAGEIGQIFDAHVMILRDRKVHEEIVREIREARRPADYCVREVFERHVQKFSSLADEYFAERARDIKDIEHRILRMLSGAREDDLACLTEDVVIVARDLTPSQTSSLDRKKVRGMAIDVGGRTSHTAIVARSLGIPAVVGLKDLTAGVRAGCRIIVDGNHGRVLVDPDDETVARYESFRREYDRFVLSLARGRDLPAETLDGHRVLLFGNIERPEDASTVLSQGGDGVGLFRTEFLFDDPSCPPTEARHYEAYRDAVARLSGKPIVIRTLDLGGDKISADPAAEIERNPFMGLRSLRYCLAHPEVFLPQLRAILRVAVHGDVRVMFPMVSAVEEVRRAKELLVEAAGQLEREGTAHRADLPVGIMVETPAAAVAADVLAPEVRFFSVGTNDLIQYAMAVDRGNERVAGLYQPAHPAILRLLAGVIRTGVEEQVEVAVCGEICGEPDYTMLLLGLGIRELSLAPAMIPQIKKVIRSVTMARAREVAESALGKLEAGETERYLHAMLRQAFPIIF
jgi:phosphotransferase system enzyme I (PtsI)